MGAWVLCGGQSESLTATLQGSLKRANFAGSNLQGVTLFGADLMEANFTGANV